MRAPNSGWCGLAVIPGGCARNRSVVLDVLCGDLAIVLNPRPTVFVPRQALTPKSPVAFVLLCTLRVLSRHTLLVEVGHVV